MLEEGRRSCLARAILNSNEYGRNASYAQFVPKHPLHGGSNFLAGELHQAAAKVRRAAAEVLVIVMTALRIIQGEGQLKVSCYPILIHIADMFVLHPVYELLRGCQ